MIQSFSIGQCGKGTLVIPDGTTAIENSQYFYCFEYIGTLNIPNTVKTIGKNAFEHCTGFIGPLLIPDSVTSIGEGAFQFYAKVWTAN